MSDKEEDIMKILFSSIKDYKQPEVIESYYFIMHLSFFLAMAKGNHYQDSWCKRGLFSISQNLERKWDRVENILFGTGEAKGVLQGNTKLLEGEETLLDGIMDLGIYCFLAAGWFMLQGEKTDNKILKNVFDKYYYGSLNFIDFNMPTQDQLKESYKDLTWTWINLGDILSPNKALSTYARIKKTLGSLRDKLRFSKKQE